MRKILLALCILSFFLNPCLWAQESVFSISPVADSIIIGVSGAVTLGSMFLLENTDTLSSPLSPAEINGFDSMLYFSYDSSLDLASDVFTGLSIASVGLLAMVAPQSQWLELAVMFTESFLLTQATKNLIKFGVGRYRPYAYFRETPDSMLKDSEVSESFPSGHSAAAFQAASFLIFSAYALDVPNKLPMSIVVGSLAVGSAALRVASGSHFLSDVLAGALIGTAFGVLVPYFHMNEREDGVNFSLLPGGLSVQLSI